MSLATPATLFAAPLPQPKRWTVSEFHQLRAEPWMETKRMILVEGEILDMPNPDPPHDAGLGLLQELLREAFGRSYWVRGQMALVLGLTTDHVPDIAVVAGSPRDFKEHPRTALLVVEVSQSTLAYDLRQKASLYAAARILDYWVVDLVHRRVIVHRDPVSDATQTYGAKYQTVTTIDETGSVNPLAAPAQAIAVAEMLP
jgi:Uma2 family endonuclease